MKKFLTVLLSFSLVILITSCEKTSTIGYQIIDTLNEVPAQLSPMVEVLQNQEGAYIFNSDSFALNPDSYVLISFGPNDSKAVTVKEIKAKNDELIITLATTDQPAPSFVMLKVLSDLPITLLQEGDTTWPPMSTQNLYFSLQGEISELTNENITLNTDTYTFKASLSSELSSTLSEETKAKYDQELIIVDYRLTTDYPEVFNLDMIVEQGEVEGVYVGQIDNSSIEVKVDNSYRTYALTPQTRQFIESNRLEPNTSVLLSYYKTETGYNVITSMQVKP